jgi:hypothetical protein
MTVNIVVLTLGSLLVSADFIAGDNDTGRLKRQIRLCYWRKKNNKGVSNGSQTILALGCSSRRRNGHSNAGVH